MAKIQLASNGLGMEEIILIFWKLPIKTSFLSICKLKGLSGKMTPSMVGSRLISPAYCSRSADGIFLKHCMKVSLLIQPVFLASCSDCDAPCCDVKVPQATLLVPLCELEHF